MYITAEQFQAASKAGIDSFIAAANLQFSAIEKLASINAAAVKSAFDESLATSRTLAGAKDLQQVANLQSQLAAPIVEKALAYTKTVYELAKDSRTEFASFAEKHIAEWNGSVVSTVEQVTKNAPVGSEAAVTALKTFIAASTGAYDNFSKLARQAGEIAEANVAATTESVKGLAKVKK